jgi:hypothetical protein
MLSSLLDTIKSQFTSKSYWLGSLLPLVLFLFANAVLLSRHSPAATVWLTKADTLTQTTVQYSEILSVVLALGYVLSILSSLMLEFLEGKRFGILKILSPLWYWTQWRRLKDLDEEYDGAVDNKWAIEKRHTEWIEKLKASRREGARSPKGMRRREWYALWISKQFRSKRALGSVLFRRRHGYRIPAALLEKAVVAVAAWLKQFDADMYRRKTLDKAHRDLLDAIQYASDRSQFERIQLLNQRQFHFPGTRPSAQDADAGPFTTSILAPTTMGNIGRTMRSYALTRYQLDLDIFWTRLQSAMQKDGGEQLKNLQDSKAQLDCMVTLCWLCAIFTSFWTVALLRLFPDSTEFEFRAVGLAGALLTFVFYEMACVSYRVFADVMRSSVDLFRFKMLESFHIQLPYGSIEERDLWVRLGDKVGYGERQHFTYKHQ